MFNLFLFCCFVLIFLIGFVLLRIALILYSQKSPPNNTLRTCKTMVVIGSGGHTSEMITLLNGLSDQFVPRLYILANTDHWSESKVKAFEQNMSNELKILCNGPGTCIPICGAAFLLRIFLMSNTKIVFVESICRVKTLSLTGRILYYFADKVLLQWPELVQKFPHAEYVERLS